MTSVILLEDEPVLRNELADYLRAQGHTVMAAATLAEFMRLFEPNKHLVAVLDLGLPDGDGLDLVLRMRRGGLRLGIVILTARDGGDAKIRGLLGGADYFISKTADLQELAATITVMERRLAAVTPPQWMLQSSPRQLVSPGGAPVPLSAQDFLVLKALALGGECVTRQTIVAALGGDYFEYDQRRLDTQMRRLRRKVHELTGEDLPVSTLRAVGYCFHAPIEVHV